MDKKPPAGQLLGMCGGNDLIIDHNYCPDRHFTHPKSCPRNHQGFAHEPLMVLVHRAILPVSEPGSLSPYIAGMVGRLGTGAVVPPTGSSPEWVNCTVDARWTHSLSI